MKSFSISRPLAPTATAVATLADGSYLLGGWDGSNYLNTMLFLASGSTNWVYRIVRSHDEGLHDGCTVAISDTSFLYIGGVWGTETFQYQGHISGFTTQGPGARDHEEGWVLLGNLATPRLLIV